MKGFRAGVWAMIGLAAVLAFSGAAAPVGRAQVAGGPTTPILDDFERPNEDPLSGGGNWAKMNPGVTPDLRLVSNGVESTGGIGRRYWTASSFGPDAEVWARVTQTGGWHQSIRLQLRVQDAGTSAWSGYELIGPWNYIFGYGWWIRRITNGMVAADLASTDGPATPMGILFRVRGSMLEAWASGDGTSNWVLVLSATDSTYQGAGRIGIGVDGGGGAPRIEEMGAGTLGGGPPPPGGAPPGGQTFGVGESGVGIHGRCGCRLFADPVNSLTGAFTTTAEDLVLPGTGVAFAWTRSYTSADSMVGRLGRGWTDSFSASLEVQGNGDVLLHGEDGQRLYYTRRPDGSFADAPGARSTLTAVAGGYELLRQDQVVYRFDSQGRLLSVRDRNGQGLSLTYDGSGRLVTVTDAAGRQATVSYNAEGLVSEVRTQDGRAVSYGYTSGRLTSVRDVRGKTWTYAYDGSGRLTSIVDPLGHVQVTNVYDGNGRVRSQTDALGRQTTFGWDAASQVATATDANGKAWQHDYDQGVLAKEIDPLGNTTQLAHDADLNEAAVTSPTGERTTMTYDAAGNLLSATAPASLGGVRKTFVYNARNDPIEVTDARGKVTSYTYTPSGNVETVTQDGVRVASYTYDAAGRVLTSTDGRGKTTTYAYDALGNLASVADPLGNRTTYTYDASGRVATRVDPKGNAPGANPADFRWSYTYDEAGNLLTETDPLGNTTTNVYDDARDGFRARGTLRAGRRRTCTTRRAGCCGRRGPIRTGRGRCSRRSPATPTTRSATS